MSGDQLRAAALKNRVAEVQSLVLGGANPCSCDDDGVSALHLGAFNGHADVLSILLANPMGYTGDGVRKSCVNLQTGAGLTALHLAAWRANAVCVRLLLLAGAKADKRDQQGQTALDRARLAGADECVVALDDSGGGAPMAEAGGRAFKAKLDQEFGVIERRRLERAARDKARRESLMELVRGCALTVARCVVRFAFLADSLSPAADQGPLDSPRSVQAPAHAVRAAHARGLHPALRRGLVPRPARAGRVGAPEPHRGPRRGHGERAAARVAGNGAGATTVGGAVSEAEDVVKMRDISSLGVTTVPFWVKSWCYEQSQPNPAPHSPAHRPSRRPPRHHPAARRQRHVVEPGLGRPVAKGGPGDGHRARVPERRGVSE